MTLCKIISDNNNFNAFMNFRLTTKMKMILVTVEITANFVKRLMTIGDMRNKINVV